MKKFLFLLVIMSSILFANVKDQGNVFKPEEVKAINDRIKLLKDQTGVDFDVVTLVEDDEKLLNPNEEVKNKVIIILLKGEDNNIKVRVAVSNDIDLSSYGDKISRKLDELERIISPKTFSDYTLELLAETGDILTSIKLDQDSLAKEQQGIDKRAIIVFFLKSLGYIVLIIVGYIVYMYINRKRILTYCRSCNKHMQIDEEIKSEKEHIKIYVCPSCGRLRRVIYKRH